MTKYQTQLLQKHSSSSTHYLHECYDKCSSAKMRAYDDCKARCSAMNGYDFKIITSNRNMFSIGYYYNQDGKTMFHYETNKTILDFIVE
jgi:hypothetical protein